MPKFLQDLSLDMLISVMFIKKRVFGCVVQNWMLDSKYWMAFDAPWRLCALLIKEKDQDKGYSLVVEYISTSFQKSFTFILCIFQPMRCIDFIWRWRKCTCKNFFVTKFFLERKKNHNTKMRMRVFPFERILY